MSFSICSQLLPPYQAWKAALRDMQAALLEFQKTASQEAKKQFETAREKATQAREAYYHLAYEAYETTTLYNNQNICLIDALVIKTIDQSLKQGGGDRASLEVSPQGRIVYCKIACNRSTTITDSLAMIHDLTALQKLDCFDNEKLHKLPKLPDGLQKLDCSNTQIHDLPKLPDGLQRLNCSNTQIHDLPKLPDGLQRLNCSNTQIHDLPKLPDGLKVLRCSSTQITDLPKLPDGLQELYCNNTKISDLPKLPDGLHVLDCSNTPAAKNPEVRRQLEEFKKKHLGVAIYD
jgi:hypothetical protein